MTARLRPDDEFLNPDEMRIEALPVTNIQQRLVTHAEIMELAANRIRNKIMNVMNDDAASATILAQYAMLAGVIEHSMRPSVSLSFMDLAVGSGTISKIAEAVANELGAPYGRSADDSNLARNGTLPSYSIPSQLASSSRVVQHESQTPPAVRPIDL